MLIFATELVKNCALSSDGRAIESRGVGLSAPKPRLEYSGATVSAFYGHGPGVPLMIRTDSSERIWLAAHAGERGSKWWP